MKWLDWCYTNNGKLDDTTVGIKSIDGWMDDDDDE